MNVALSVLVVGVALAVSAAGGLPVVTGILRLAARQKDARPEGGEGGPTSEKARRALRGGLWIGVLERLGVTASIALGYPAGVAVVVAIKGLGRFSELKDNPDASERFVVGTLASVLWAAAWGAAAVWVLGWF